MASIHKKRKNGYPKGIFREIFVSANREMTPFGVVFVYPPENFEQRPLGTIFGIIKIADTSPESSFVANLLASVIKKEYFGKPDRPAYDSFEASLRKANLALAELARQGSVKWIGKICFAGGVIEKNNFHFSRLGTTSILLLRGGMLADIGAGMGSDAPGGDSHPLKTFSDISSGKIDLGDCLILTTSDLLEIFSVEEIRQNAARFSREEFPEILSASLTANSELSGAIVVSLVSEEEIPAEIENRLIGNPPKRQKPTAPQIPSSQNISKNYAAPAYFSSESVVRKEKNIYVSESEDLIPRKSFAKNALILANNIFTGAKNGIFFVWKKTFRLFGRIEWQKIFSSIKEVRPPRWRLNLQDWSKRIDFSKKNTKIVAAIGALLLLAIVVFSLTRSIARQNLAVQQAQSVQNPPPSAVPSPAADADINAKTIETVSSVAALPANSSQLIFMNDLLFSLTGDKSILKIDPASGTTEKIDSDIAGGKFTLAAAMPDLNTIFILTADKKVLSFTPSNKKFLENAIALPDKLNASDMKAYLTYIYILDSSANQIYRYPRAEGGFGEIQNWLKSGQDIKGADKFAINEDIFVVNNLNIIPLFQGKIDSAIDFQKPQTPLRIDGIFTDTGFANIYVLDNKNHRILQYGKDGKIAAQYFSDQIFGIKNLAVDEKNKVIYLQNVDSVSKFSME